MNEEKKFKMIFGKKVLKKEFKGLQNQARLMKPASMNKLLGKRDWDVNLLRQAPLNKTVVQPQNRNVRQLKRSSSLITRLGDFCKKETEENPRLLADIQAFKQVNTVEKEHKKQPKLQVDIGLGDLNERVTRENLNDNLAYNLGNFLSKLSILYFLIRTLTQL